MVSLLLLFSCRVQRVIAGFGGRRDGLGWRDRSWLWLNAFIWDGEGRFWQFFGNGGSERYKDVILGR